MSVDANSYSWEQLKLGLFKFYIENLKPCIENFLVVIVIVILFLYVCDYLYKDKYKVKWRVRVLRNTTGGGQDIFQKYWLWQINKKKLLISDLRNRNTQPFMGKAMQRKRLKKSRIPFRREIYGKND